jgi:hypothetical protein
MSMPRRPASFSGSSPTSKRRTALAEASNVRRPTLVRPIPLADEWNVPEHADGCQGVEAAGQLALDFGAPLPDPRA